MQKPLLPLPPFSLAILASSLWPISAHAVTATAHVAKFSLSSVLSLPFMLAIAVALHVLLGRGTKAILASAAPLATGELEAGGYQRGVYGSPERAMLEVAALAMASGLVMWAASAFQLGWLWAIAIALLVGAVALDILRWQRVTSGASYVWYQEGLRGQVHQVAIDNIAEVSVDEQDVPGSFTLRHLKNNRVCRLLLEMKEGKPLKLPKTNAADGLESVEALANHIRTRQQFIEERQKVNRSSDDGSKAAQQVAQQPSSVDAELARELRRLRKQALAPNLPPAVKASVKPASNQD